MATSYFLDQSRKLMGTSATAPTVPRIGGLGFDWAVILTSLWMSAGAMYDAWYHSHTAKLDTFFTPAHATIYSGIMAVGAVHFLAVFINHRRGYSWKESIPPGYGLSFIGVGLGMLAGLGDMIWHIVFGIEANISAAISPTHIAAVSVMGILGTGPLRAAWRRYRPEDTRSWLTAFPAVASMSIPLLVWMLFLSWSTVLVNAWWIGTPAEAFVGMGVVGILIQGGMLAGFVLFLVRRMQLPFGAFTLLFLIGTAALIPVSSDVAFYLPAAIAGGLVADTLSVTLRPSVERPWTLRLIAFVTPASYFLTFFAILLIQNQVRWNIHDWFGASVMSGFVGLLLSCLVIPPRMAPTIQEAPKG